MSVLCRVVSGTQLNKLLRQMLGSVAARVPGYA